MTPDTLLLFKTALSLIKASFPNNKAVQLQRGAICFLFFLSEISRELSSKSLLQRRRAIPRARAPCCRGAHWNGNRAVGSTGALLTGSKATGAREILSLFQALKHHRDHDCSLLNGKKIPIFSLFHRGTYSSVQTGPSSQPVRQAQSQHRLHKARNFG